MPATCFCWFLSLALNDSYFSSTGPSRPTAFTPHLSVELTFHLRAYAGDRYQVAKHRHHWHCHRCYHIEIITYSMRHPIVCRAIERPLKTSSPIATGGIEASSGKGGPNNFQGHATIACRDCQIIAASEDLPCDRCWTVLQ
ncbi:hypothetical protein BDW72DRAFT_172501 [Aspergillus terricola var. indicus]